MDATDDRIGRNFSDPGHDARDTNKDPDNTHGDNISTASKIFPVRLIRISLSGAGASAGVVFYHCGITSLFIRNRLWIHRPCLNRKEAIRWCDGGPPGGQS